MDGSRLGKKREERGRGGGLKGLKAEGDEKSEEERGRGREEGRNWGTVLSMHSGETRTLHFPPPLLLLPPLKLPHTSHSLAALFHEPNRFRSYIPLPLPLPFSPHLHPYPHSYPHTVRVYTRLGDEGRRCRRHNNPASDPGPSYYTYIHTYIQHVHVHLGEAYVCISERQKPTVDGFSDFFFFLFAPPETSVRPPLPPPLPLPLTSSSGIIDFAWRPDSRIRSAGTRC